MLYYPLRLLRYAIYVINYQLSITQQRKDLVFIVNRTTLHLTKNNVKHS